jgi:hypothetical protein
MLSVEQVKGLLQDREVKVVAARCGLHPKTLWAIKRGAKKVTSSRTLEKLTVYFVNEQNV